MKGRLLLGVCCALALQAHCQDTLLDTSFAVGPGANGQVYSIFIQGDGKILVGGQYTAIAGHAASNFARLNSNGQFDETFLPQTDGGVIRMLAQPDGKIIVAGLFTNLQGTPRHRIGRLMTNGLVDTNFDAGTNFANDEGVFGIALQPDGKILAGSFSAFGISSKLARLETNGQVDGTFIQTNSFDSYVRTILVQSNGTIWAGAEFGMVNGTPVRALAKFDSNGQLLTNTNAFLNGNSGIETLVQLTNGNILAGGSFYRSNEVAPKVLVQLTSDGQLDTNFTTDVFVGGETSATPGVSALVVQPDGKIVAVGDFYEVGGYWRRHLVRLSSQGRVDPCFDPGIGLVEFPIPIALARQPDGRILVGGYFIVSYPTGPRNIARFLPQSDCDNMRVYLLSANADGYQVAGTAPPGGTNRLQTSSNLVDWVDIDVTTNSYMWTYESVTNQPAAFFRVKKTL